MNRNFIFLSIIFIVTMSACQNQEKEDNAFYKLSRATLKDKIKGAWAVQTIGVTYGGPTEFNYNTIIIPDSVTIHWSDSMMYDWMTNRPGLYDDIYMDLTFVDVMQNEGIDAPAESHAKAYANAKYMLWHANQQGRYNVLHGIMPPESGHWKNNPHADDIDFQIEADFAGIMNPGMPGSAIEICDRVGHIMNSGDGYYGGVMVAAMYSYAFVMDDIVEIIEKALATIPETSTYYQCQRDVIDWSAQYPDDWKKTWQLIEDKWGNDIGCPDGVKADFNIDAKLNSAYVLLGLLYGAGDLGKTMEIATRAGQDSDCNPATAGAILGTIMGYDAIPDYWADGLSMVEDMDFKYTTMSLNEVYDISYNHALEMVQRNGGELLENDVKIMRQTPSAVPLEQNFPGYMVAEKRKIATEVSLSDAVEKSWSFEGIGVVLRGRVAIDKSADVNTDALYDTAAVKADFYLDEELVKTMDLPLNYTTRAHELFFQYEIPDGIHTLKMEIRQPIEGIKMEIMDLIVYGDN